MQSRTLAIYSHTTPSPSPSRMKGYAGWPRGTGTMPWPRASAQVIRPFRLSSQRRRASTSPDDESSRETGDVADTGSAVPLARKMSSVDEQDENTCSRTSASGRSMVRSYLRRTSTIRPANQHRFMGGSQPAASWSRFSWRLSPGAARVRLSGSEAKRRRVARSAAHNPLSCASERATICSMSVSRVLEKRSSV